MMDNELRYASKKCSKNGPFRLRCTATAFSLKRSVLFRSTVCFVPLRGQFRFDCFPLQGFLATDPDSINFAKNLAKPRPVALIPPAAIFAIYRPV